MASKFADKDAAEESEDDDASSFEEIPKPVERPGATAARQEQKVGISSPPKQQDTTPAPTPTTSAPEAQASRQEQKIGISSPPKQQDVTPTPPPTASTDDAAAPTRSASSAAGGLKEVLGEIRGMIQAQSRQIEELTKEVAELKTKVR